MRVGLTIFFIIFFSKLLVMIGAGEYAPIPPVFGPISPSNFFYDLAQF